MLPVTVTDSELRYLWESGAFRGHHGATQPEDLTTTKAAEKPQAQRYSHVARKYNIEQPRPRIMVNTGVAAH